MKVINFEKAKTIHVEASNRYLEVATTNPEKVLKNWEKVARNRVLEEVMLLPVHAHNVLIKLVQREYRKP